MSRQHAHSFDGVEPKKEPLDDRSRLYHFLQGTPHSQSPSFSPQSSPTTLAFRGGAGAGGGAVPPGAAVPHPRRHSFDFAQALRIPSASALNNHYNIPAPHPRHPAGGGGGGGGGGPGLAGGHSNPSTRGHTPLSLAEAAQGQLDDGQLKAMSREELVALVSTLQQQERVLREQVNLHRDDIPALSNFGSPQPSPSPSHTPSLTRPPFSQFGDLLPRAPQASSSDLFGPPPDVKPHVPERSPPLLSKPPPLGSPNAGIFPSHTFERSPSADLSSPIASMPNLDLRVPRERGPFKAEEFEFLRPSSSASASASGPRLQQQSHSRSRGASGGSSSGSSGGGGPLLSGNIGGGGLGIGGGVGAGGAAPLEAHSEYHRMLALQFAAAEKQLREAHNAGLAAAMAGGMHGGGVNPAAAAAAAALMHKGGVPPDTPNAAAAAELQKKNRAAKNVCENCFYAKVACDYGRPCARCVRLRKDRCVDRRLVKRAKYKSKIGSSVVPFLPVQYLEGFGLPRDALTKLDLKSTYSVDDLDTHLQNVKDGTIRAFTAMADKIKPFPERAKLAIRYHVDYLNSAGTPFEADMIAQLKRVCGLPDNCGIPTNPTIYKKFSGLAEDTEGFFPSSIKRDMNSRCGIARFLFKQDECRNEMRVFDYNSRLREMFGLSKPQMIREFVYARCRFFHSGDWEEIVRDTLELYTTAWRRLRAFGVPPASASAQPSARASASSSASANTSASATTSASGNASTSEDMKIDESGVGDSSELSAMTDDIPMSTSSSASSSEPSSRSSFSRGEPPPAPDRMRSASTSSSSSSSSSAVAPVPSIADPSAPLPPIVKIHRMLTKGGKSIPVIFLRFHGHALMPGQEFFTEILVPIDAGGERD